MQLVQFPTLVVVTIPKLEQCTIKVLIKVSVCLIQHCKIKRYGDTDIAPYNPKPGTRWRCAVNFKLCLIYPTGKCHTCTHWIGGWVGPRASFSTLKRITLTSDGKRKWVFSQESHSLVTTLTEVKPENLHALQSTAKRYNSGQPLLMFQ
jgi:hypothetical protein